METEILLEDSVNASDKEKSIRLNIDGCSVHVDLAYRESFDRCFRCTRTGTLLVYFKAVPFQSPGVTIPSPERIKKTLDVILGPKTSFPACPLHIGEAEEIVRQIKENYK